MARCVDKSKRIPKLHERELFDILYKHNNGFVDYYRSHIMHDGKKIYGTVFKLEKEPIAELRKIIMRYSNTIFFKGHAQYAPELKFYYIMLLDHSVRERMS